MMNVCWVLAGYFQAVRGMLELGIGRIFIHFVSSSFFLRIYAPVNMVIWSDGVKCVSLYLIHHQKMRIIVLMFSADYQGCITEHKTTFCQ